MQRRVIEMLQIRSSIPSFDRNIWTTLKAWGNFYFRENKIFMSALTFSNVRDWNSWKSCHKTYRKTSLKHVLLNCEIWDMRHYSSIQLGGSSLNILMGECTKVLSALLFNRIWNCFTFTPFWIVIKGTFHGIQFSHHKS